MRAVYIKMDWTALCMHALAKSMTARMTTPSQLLFLLAACAGLLLRTQAADLLDNDIMEVGSELADEDAPSISEELINSCRSKNNSVVHNVSM